VHLSKFRRDHEEHHLPDQTGSWLDHTIQDRATAHGHQTAQLDSFPIFQGGHHASQNGQVCDVR